MQKFILGSEQDGLPAVPLRLRYERYSAALYTASRKHKSNSAASKHYSRSGTLSSGLLKDMILVHNPKIPNASAISTLLEQAARRWKNFTNLWESYCNKERDELVRPILVVQVEDGTDKVVTRSPVGRYSPCHRTSGRTVVSQ